MNGEHVGSWSMDRNTHRFTYSDSWLDNDLRRPLSLSMPLREVVDAYQGDRVESFFDNLLPDSVDIRRRIQGRVGAASTRAFDLLTEIGNDCIGAVQLVREVDQAAEVRSITGDPLDNDQVIAQLRGAVSTGVPGIANNDFLRLSLAGAQEKTGLLRHNDCWYKPSGATPTTHILKLPMGRVGVEQADLSTSVENEWLCGRLLEAWGLPVAQSEILKFDDDLTALAVERFDRRLASDGSWWIRVPQEDMCQATATSPAQKYEADGGPGIEPLMEFLLGSVNSAKDRYQFLKAQVLFWILCAPDGHAKNFSVFIEAAGRYQLTPLYDVLSAYPFLGKSREKIAPQRINLAMAWTGQNRHYRWSSIQSRHIRATAHAVGMKSELARLQQDIDESVEAVIDTVAEQLPADFPMDLADAIFMGCKDRIKKMQLVAG